MSDTLFREFMALRKEKEAIATKLSEINEKCNSLWSDITDGKKGSLVGYYLKQDNSYIAIMEQEATDVRVLEINIATNPRGDIVRVSKSYHCVLIECIIRDSELITSDEFLFEYKRASVFLNRKMEESIDGPKP